MKKEEEPPPNPSTKAWRGSSAPPCFTRFIAIDWSGARGVRQPGIAVASCTVDEAGPVGDAAPVLVRPGHVWSRAEVLDWVLDAVREPALVGFDLSPALPFADVGAYLPGWDRSPSDARALWRLVDEIAGLDPNLGAESFVGHAEAGRHFRHHGRLGDRFGTGRGRLRVVERSSLDARISSPTSVFNLVGAAQVGKASLSGMRLWHRLDGRVPLWPFDPLPAAGAVVVEIYTALAARAAGLPKGRTKVRDAPTLDRALAALGSAPHAPLPRYDDHSTDALLSAAWLRSADPAWWSPPALTPELARTEGWTFGVP